MYGHVSNTGCHFSLYPDPYRLLVGEQEKTDLPILSAATASRRSLIAACRDNSGYHELQSRYFRAASRTPWPPRGLWQRLFTQDVDVVLQRNADDFTMLVRRHDYDRDIRRTYGWLQDIRETSPGQYSAAGRHSGGIRILLHHPASV